MDSGALLKKLRIKPGFSIRIINPPEGYLERLDPLPSGAWIARPSDGDLDFVQIFARDSQDIQRHLAAALTAVKEDGWRGRANQRPGDGWPDGADLSEASYRGSDNSGPPRGMPGRVSTIL